MPADQGLFVLGVQIQNIAEEVKRLEKLEDAADRVQKKLSSLGGAKKSAAKLGFTKELEKGFSEISKVTKGISGIADKQTKAIKNLTSGYKSALSAVKKFSDATKTAGNVGKDSLDQTNKGVKNFNGMMGVAIGKIIRYRLAFGMWREVTQLMREALDVTIAMNSAMVGLEKVMNPVTTNFKFMAAIAFDMGRRFGQSAIATAESMKVWAQQGKNMADVAMLTAATLLGVNSANLTAMESVEALTAATKAYNIEAAASPEIIDKWMAVQARHAVTAKDLANATKAIAAAARVAGVGMDELNGVIAAIGSVTRKSGTAVANSFKTMLARIQRMPAVKTFQNLGIAVYKSATEMRALPQILGELSQQWGTLDSAVKQNVAITVGGIRRYSDFMVLMDNFQEYLSATEHSFYALGEAQIASALQVESYASLIQRMKTTFEELGHALGEAGIIDVVINLTKSMANLAKVGTKFAGPITAIAKGFTYLGVVIGGAAAASWLLKGATTFLGTSYLSLSKSVAVTTAALNGSAAAATKAAGAVTILSTATKGFIGTASAIGGIVIGVTLLISVLTTLFGKIEDGSESFKEMNDKMLATVGTMIRVRDEHKKDLVTLNAMMAAKDKFLKQAEKVGLTGDEAETYAATEMAKAYGATAKEFGLFIKATKDGVAEYDFSNKALANIHRIFTERVEKSNKTLLATAIVNRDKHKAILDDMGKAIEDFAESRNTVITNLEGMPVAEASAFTLADLLPPDPAQMIDMWTRVQIDMFRVLEEARIDEHLAAEFKKRIEGAFEQLTFKPNTNKLTAEAGEVFVKLFRDIGTIVDTESATRGVELEGLQKTVDGYTKVRPLMADANYFVLDSASKLTVQIAKLRKETSIFERDNTSMGKHLRKAGAAFDEAGAKASFYKKQLKNVYNIRAAHELTIVMQEQLVAHHKLEKVGKAEEDTAKLKLETYKKEALAVSNGTALFRARTLEITAGANKELAIQQKKSEQAGLTKKQSAVIKKADKDIRDAASAKHRENTKNFYTILKTAGAYGVLMMEAWKYRDALKATNEEVVTHFDELQKEKNVFAEIRRAAAGNVELANLRKASEKTIIKFQKEGLESEIARHKLKIKEYEANEKIEKHGKSIVKHNQAVIVLKSKIIALDAKSDLLGEKKQILKQQSAITLETAKQEAITSLLVDQLSMEAQSEFKVLQLEKDRIIAQMRSLELRRQALGFSRDDASIIKQQETLSLKLLTVKKKIITEQQAIIKNYKAQLSQVSSEIQSMLSSGLGGWASKQRASYEELGQLQQDIADAERDRQIAINDANEESLWEANRQLKELKERQDELGGSANTWAAAVYNIKEALKDVGNQMSDMINQKLAEQFVDNLLEMSMGDSTMGETFAKGIVLRPSGDFELTAENLNKALTQAMNEGTLTFREQMDAGFVMGSQTAKEAIIEALSIGATTSGTVTATAAPAAATDAPADAPTLTKEGQYVMIPDYEAFTAAGESFKFQVVQGFSEGSFQASILIQQTIINAFIHAAELLGLSEEAAIAKKILAEQESAIRAGETIRTSMSMGGTDAATKIGVAMNKGGATAGKAMEVTGITFGQRLGKVLESGGRMIGNMIGTSLGGGGQGAGMGASFGGMIPGMLGMAGPWGIVAGMAASALGGVIGGMFDDDKEVDTKPLFGDITKPVPVNIEGINRNEVMLHDISIGVEANFLDPSQLDPIAMRNLAEHVRKETEDLLKRENLWS